MDPLNLTLGVLEGKGRRLDQSSDFLHPVLNSIRELQSPMKVCHGRTLVAFATSPSSSSSVGKRLIWWQPIKDLIDGLIAKIDSKTSELDILYMGMLKSFDDCIDVYKGALYQLGEKE